MSDINSVELVKGQIAYLSYFQGIVVDQKIENKTHISASASSNSSSSSSYSSSSSSINTKTNTYYTIFMKDSSGTEESFVINEDLYIPTREGHVLTIISVFVKCPDGSYPSRILAVLNHSMRKQKKDIKILRFDREETGCLLELLPIALPSLLYAITVFVFISAGIIRKLYVVSTYVWISIPFVYGVYYMYKRLYKKMCAENERNNAAVARVESALEKLIARAQKSYDAWSSEGSMMLEKM